MSVENSDSDTEARVEKSETVSVRMSKIHKGLLERRAARKGYSLTDYVRYALQKIVDKELKKDDTDWK